MNTDNYSNQERLELISNMINEAKSKISKNDSFYLLLWGWTLVVANFGHYIIDKYNLYSRPWHVWNIIWFVYIIMAIRMMKKWKTSLIKGHYENSSGLIWIFITACIFVTLLFMHKINYQHQPFILLFAGIGQFMMGILLRFKPFIIGAVVLFIGSVSCFFISIMEQNLLAGIVYILGFLIPGYMVRKIE